ncbi:serine hydrolase domain-containing protein [Lysobacter sp. Root604]|uniref:serine hydrolase domain-containing protein n=1 Tax=Lysobacter sp. Root604 TaxID=1736568 RepID=UPI0006FDF99E|nr:serine hydrolase domain-containing protein [Lysobacter sp. Root604]KRA16387.1 serine hydrolase [Lysobacter sp. Root604]
MILKRTMTMLLALALLLPGAAFADEALSAALTRQMEVNRQRYGIAGQALLVAHNGEVLFCGADGEADVERHERVTADHVFAAYSLSKLFASVLIMQLVEQGQVDLDAPASAYVPGLPKAWQAIRVREFLDHTSGVPEYFAQRQDGAASTAMAFPKDLPAVFASLADTPLQFATGTDTRYTQSNFLVLTALLEAHYGKPYAQIADERIMRKLQLGHTWLGPAALPKQGVVRSYVGKDGRLVPEQDIDWPDYAHGHAGLYLTLDDLGRFLKAVTSGELVGKATLRRLWQPRTLANGRRGGFAAGWEYGESGAYRQVGHDGGTRVRVRVLFQGSLDGDVYVFAYLTNGSVRNVWSRVLVGSAMAVVAPKQFPAETLSEALVRYALQAPVKDDAQAQAGSIRAQHLLNDAELERAINTAGYSVRENLGIDPALRVFELNTVLFPDSPNTWDSLAEAHAAKGDQDKAKALYEKAHRLAGRAKAGEAR